MSILSDPILEEDLKLGVDLPPILPPASPFPSNDDHGQVQHF